MPAVTVDDILPLPRIPAVDPATAVERTVRSVFLMGDEVGAQKAYTYNKFNENKEDLGSLRQGVGSLLFRFYQDIIRLRLANPALRSRNIEVIHTNNGGRVLAFRRWEGVTEYLVAASLNNTAFDNPCYMLSHPSLDGAGWRECFNSDSAIYGGSNVGNMGATLCASGETVSLIIPANGFVVLERTT